MKDELTKLGAHFYEKDIDTVTFNAEIIKIHDEPLES